MAYTTEAVDAEGDTLTYSLSGTDASLFTINAMTGEVRFTDAPDFEMPGDAGSNNVYDITVTASDGDNSTWRRTRPWIAWSIPPWRRTRTATR